MSDRSAEPDPILAELLDKHFRLHPRAVLIASLFGCLAAWIMRDALPPAFLWAWLGTFLLLNVVRLIGSLRFAGAPATAPGLRMRRRFAVITNALGGLTWGVLGATAILQGPEAARHEFIVFFVLAVFATFQAVGTSIYAPAFYGWLLCTMVPTFIAAALEPTGAHLSFILLGAVFVPSVLLVAHQTNAHVRGDILKRRENEKLLDELTRQKGELDKANAAKTHFLAAASHDLRQPMQALVLLVESLQERITEPGTRRIVKSIRSSVVVMSALLNAILDVSKFDAGTVRPERRHFRVNDVLERLRSSYAQQAAGRNLELRIVRSGAVVESDPILLYRILANIASNALRYTDRGRVLVGCRRRREGVSIEVLDTGPGIPPDEIGAIFREFYQLGNPQRDREQGLGLGLAIVERTARLLDHPLAVRSKVGHGSVFSILVPYGAADRIHERVRERERTSLEGCTVLVVEDEKDIRAAMTILLESWGCEVLVAASGKEALYILESKDARPDVVLADYRLPGEENGLRVIRAVKHFHPPAVGILISGDIAPEVLRQADDAGVKLLHKPLRPARLRSLMGHVWREHVVAAEAKKAVEAAAL